MQRKSRNGDDSDSTFQQKLFRNVFNYVISLKTTIIRWVPNVFSYVGCFVFQQITWCFEIPSKFRFLDSEYECTVHVFSLFVLFLRVTSAGSLLHASWKWDKFTFPWCFKEELCFLFPFWSLNYFLDFQPSGTFVFLLNATFLSGKLKAGWYSVFDTVGHLFQGYIPFYAFWYLEKVSHQNQWLTSDVGME